MFEIKLETKENLVSVYYAEVVPSKTDSIMLDGVLYFVVSRAFFPKHPNMIILTIEKAVK